MKPSHAIGLGLVGLLTYKAFDEFRESQRLVTETQQPPIPGTNIVISDDRARLGLSTATQRAQDSYRYAIGALAVSALTSFYWNR